MQLVKAHLVSLLTEASLYVPDMSTFKAPGIKYSYRISPSIAVPPIDSDKAPDPDDPYHHPNLFRSVKAPFEFDVVHDKTGERLTHKGQVMIADLDRRQNLWTLGTQKLHGLEKTSDTDPSDPGSPLYKSSGYRGNEHSKRIVDLTHHLMDHFFQSNDREHWGDYQPTLISSTWEPGNKQLERIKARYNFAKMRSFVEHPSRSGKYDIAASKAIKPEHRDFLHLGADEGYGLEHAIAVTRR